MTEEMLPLDLLDDFPDHPFRVRMDEDMEELVQSVRERGVMTPLLVRPKEDGRYEIISGHRRKKACELADIREVPCKVREMSRDEAIRMLDPRQRELVRQVHGEGISQTEIARREGVTEAAISRRMSRIYKRLKSYMDQMEIKQQSHAVPLVSGSVDGRKRKKHRRDR